MKKLIFTIFLFGLIFGAFNFVLAKEERIEINFFYSPTCAYCAKEWKFLDKLKEEYPEVKINRFSIFEKENIELLKKFYQEYKVPSVHYGMVPATFTNKKYFIGFNEEIKKSIESCIQVCQGASKGRGNVTVVDIEGNIKLPIIGKFNIKKYSLPTLTVILGFLDGFNVCSLGALVLILGLVLALRSRKKILIFGGLYILVTSLVYGFLMVLWYQIFSLLTPYIRIMKILIGFLGLGGGIYFLKEFFRFRKQGAVCESGLGERLFSKFSEKFHKKLKESSSIFLLIGGVLLFAAIITIVEFPCSAAVPVVYAGLLAQSHLPELYYLLYIALYLFFYMLDEIIVFLIAFFTMKLWLASNRAITWITLVEAVILFILGFYYLFGFNAVL